MSHLTRLQVDIKNKKCLTDTIEAMGYGYVEGSEAKMSSGYGWSINADILLTKDGSKLPVGFTWENDAYTISKDFYGTGINANKFADDLFVTYNKLNAIQELEKMGYSYEIIETETELMVVGQDWSDE